MSLVIVRQAGRKRQAVLTLPMLLLAAGFAITNARATDAARESLAIVVMDPLAKELACACVRGYAQRNYQALAGHLGEAIGCQTEVSFSEDLADSIAKLAPGRQILVIGKSSVVEKDAAAARFDGKPLCRLTGTDGATTLTGIFVAKANDPARRLEDLAGRRVIFGARNADEKYSAALDALRDAGIMAPKNPETREACTEAALDVVDSTENPPPVGVISSYALALLEGCGSIKKGDLKVIGRTKPVPFVTVFVGNAVPATRQQQILEVLLALKKNEKLCRAMETRDGFVPINAPGPETRRSANSGVDWPEWRGPARDGQVPWLPSALTPNPRVVWQKAAMNGGLAGIAVAGGCVFLADRDPSDTRDVFRCLDAETGASRWWLDYPASGKLDYGQFPRATPVIRQGRAFLLGAFGDLNCVELGTGKVLWRKHLVQDLGGRLPKWGFSATPLLVEELLIVNPGGPQASLVALETRTGEIRWSSPGRSAAYASFITATLGGHRQIVGYDATTLGGWDPATGRRLWTLRPCSDGDFNVPTPLVFDGHLLVSTENNGTRLYAFSADGRIVPQPVAEFADLAPDTATPVVVNGLLLGAHLGLYGLDCRQALKCAWRCEDKAFDGHTTLFASGNRALAVTLSGEALLLEARPAEVRILSRVRLFEEDIESYAHPALVGYRLFIRGPDSIRCLELGGS